MAVSKRLRFEVLRRDSHTCQYCGESAPDTTLHVDHVIPVALGGTDQPGNLVAACKDCNLGKSSVPAEAPIVETINSRAASYALDMTDRATRIRALLEVEEDYLYQFADMWNRWTMNKKPVPLPRDYKASIYRFARMGVPIELIQRAVEIAMEKQNIQTAHGEFQYMAGVIYRTLDETSVTADLSEGNVKVYTEAELEERACDERIEAYEIGWKKAEEQLRGNPVGT